MKQRYLGLDYGTKTVGLAVSDDLGITAQGVETIRRKARTKLRQTLARIDELARLYQADLIVVGLPRNMNNTEGDRVLETRAFGDMVEKRTGLPVVYWDERLTTVEAERVLMAGGVRREHRKERIDQMAAVLILQSYMAASPVPDVGEK